jgi:hypothetical protein
MLPVPLLLLCSSVGYCTFAWPAKQSKAKQSNTKQKTVRCQWLTPVILATQEADIRRIMVWSQAGQIVLEISSRKNPSQKRDGGVAQGVGPEFKPPYHRANQTKPKKKKNEGSNGDPSTAIFWDYRHVPPCPAPYWILFYVPGTEQGGDLTHINSIFRTTLRGR